MNEINSIFFKDIFEFQRQRIRIMNNNELVMYLLVNKDLNMKKGKIAGQCAHACTTYTYYSHNDESFLKWFNDCQKKIILKAPQELLEELEEQGYLTIRDRGYTQIPENSLTVVNLGVLTRSEAGNIVKDIDKMPLL